MTGILTLGTSSDSWMPLLCAHSGDTSIYRHLPHQLLSSVVSKLLKPPFVTLSEIHCATRQPCVRGALAPSCGWQVDRWLSKVGDWFYTHLLFVKLPQSVVGYFFVLYHLGLCTPLAKRVLVSKRDIKKRTVIVKKDSLCLNLPLRVNIVVVFFTHKTGRICVSCWLLPY